MEYAMLKVDKETHKRVMMYISKEHVKTGHKMTVDETINTLLDIAEGLNGKK
ncbi:MAG: hypothetical protein WBZ42_10865 [Halobacteriota archaeon]